MRDTPLASTRAIAAAPSAPISFSSSRSSVSVLFSFTRSYYHVDLAHVGEVVKFLVYNARKRHVGGDSAAGYFERTECVAGVQDMRFQDLMPDVFHWLGMKRIDRWISMSNMKFEPMRQQGIEIVARVPIPDDLIPPDAQVEMDAKKAAGYYTDETVSKPEDLEKTKGRKLDDY